MKNKVDKGSGELMLCLALLVDDALERNEMHGKNVLEALTWHVIDTIKLVVWTWVFGIRTQRDNLIFI